jgi:hypothetical protein
MAQWWDPGSWFGNRSEPQVGQSPQPIPGQGNTWGAPGPSRGLLARLRQMVGGYVGPQLSAGTQQEREITREKAAGGPRGVVFPNFLPYQDDNYTNESGAMRMAYRQMLADPNCSAAFRGLVLAVAALDLQVQPASKKSERDRQIADFVRYILAERVAGCVPELIWSVLSGGLIDGYSVLEKVWALEDRGRWAGKYVLSSLKPKDVNQDLVLQTDEFRNVVGILGLRYNAGIEFSPADFLIYRHLPLFGSPTGLSAFRCVYSRYWVLDTAVKLRAIAAEKRALPIAVGYYQDNTIKASLEAALSKLKSQNWTSAPERAKIEVVNLAGSADSIFEDLCRSLREEIFLGIQGATLQALTGGQGEQRGNSQVHKDTKELTVWHLAATIESLLNDRTCGLIRDVVDLNFVVSEYPRATLSAVDPQELLQELQIDSGLLQMGLKLSKTATYERFGRTPPEDEGDVLTSPQQGPGGPGGPGGGAGGGMSGMPPDEGGGGGGGGSDEQPFDEDAPAGEGPAADPFTVASARQPARFDSPSNGSSTSPAEPDVALAGADGHAAEKLLRASVRQGAAVLGTLAEEAVKRLLESGKPRAARRLFTDDERRRLAAALAATNATADLLGRARVRKRLEQAQQHAERFSESDATDFSCFDEAPIHPLAPRAAVDWFRRLVPDIAAEPDAFESAQRQQAFTAAGVTERSLLDRVKDVIAGVLETGQGAKSAPGLIDRVLDEAGVTPRNPQRAEMIFRTNAMQAYNAGTHAEMQDPDVADEFPAWRYLGIRDGRQGKDHEPHFDHYYPSSVRFEDVRGPRVFNCRCTSQPIHRSQWRRLRTQGVDFSSFAEPKGAGKGAGKLAGKPCGPGQSAARTGCTPKSKAAAAKPARPPKAVPPKPAPKPPKPAKAKPPTADEMHAHVQSLLADPQKVTPQAVADLATKLQAMTGKDLDALKKKLGAKGSGTKAALAKKVAEHVVSKLKSAAPPAAPPTPEPASKPAPAGKAPAKQPGANPAAPAPSRIQGINPQTGQKETLVPHEGRWYPANRDGSPDLEGRSVSDATVQRLLGSGEYRHEGAAPKEEAAPSGPPARVIDNPTKWGKEHYAKWAESLTPEERSAGKFYMTSPQFRDLNKELRKPGSNRTGKAAMDKVGKPLDEMIARSKLPEPAVLFRGMQGNSPAVKALRKGLESGTIGPGSVITDPAYVSTSMREKPVMNDFANEKDAIVFRISAPKGAHGAYMPAIESIGEDEVLLPRGSRFRIDSVGRDDQGRHIAHVSLVTEGK